MARRPSSAARGRTFYAGADIDELDRGLRSPGLLELVEAGDRSPLPVVAALHGSVYGGGVVVACAADRRLAAEGTRFAMPELSLGLLPTFGGTVFLVRWLGVEAALSLSVDGAVWSADEALRAGLIDEIVPAADLDERAQALAEERPAKRRVRDASCRTAEDPVAVADAFARRREHGASHAPDFEAATAVLDLMEPADGSGAGRRAPGVPATARLVAVTALAPAVLRRAPPAPQRPRRAVDRRAHRRLRPGAGGAAGPRARAAGPECRARCRMARRADRGHAGPAAPSAQPHRPLAGTPAMNFDFSDDIRAMAGEVRRALERVCPMDEVRRCLAADGFSAATWRALAELGVLGAAVPERWGGSGLGPLELAACAEEVGRACAPVPMLPSVFLATEALLAAGTDAQRARWLPELAAGRVIGTVVFGTLAPEGGRAHGRLAQVPSGASAGLLIVVDDTGPGLCVALADAHVRRRPLPVLDPG
jgi:enoyl-CoA hydratase/carnithine racemase